MVLRDIIRHIGNSSFKRVHGAGCADRIGGHAQGSTWGDKCVQVALMGLLNTVRKYLMR